MTITEIDTTVIEHLDHQPQCMNHPDMDDRQCPNAAKWIIFWKGDLCDCPEIADPMTACDDCLQLLVKPTVSLGCRDCGGRWSPAYRYVQRTEAL